MTMSTAVDVRMIPRIKHAEAMQVTAVENRKFAAALGNLQPGDWAQPTDCTRWDVRALAAHVVGSAAGQASPREFIRQVRAGRPVVAEIGAQYWWDGMNEIHVREREALSVDAPRVVYSPPGWAARRWNWTRSSSAAPSPSGYPARASFATPYRSETPQQLPDLRCDEINVVLVAVV